MDFTSGKTERTAPEVRVYTVPEVAKLLQVSQRTVYNYLADGKIKAVKIGRDYRILSTDIEDFLHTSSGLNKDAIEFAFRFMKLSKKDRVTVLARIEEMLAENGKA